MDRTARRRRTASALAATALAIGSAGCSSGLPTGAPPTPTRAPITVSVRPDPSTRVPSPAPRLDGAGTKLPTGGRSIFPGHRVVAFYGAPGGSTLGALGDGSPDTVAGRIQARAAAFAGFGKPVLPAMELIATVAQGSPGPDHDYSKPIGDARIQTYLDAAHRHHMLLLLDIQPGTGEFLPQVQALRPFLLDPDVSVAVDPEWKVQPGQKPGNGRIGSATAASVNAVGDYLSRLVTENDLPDKLLVVHQFTRSMLPDRQNITQHKGIEMVLHDDGEGSIAAKLAVYRKLAFPKPFHAGFKVFFRQDARLMSPQEIMAQSPVPDMISYQ